MSIDICRVAPFCGKKTTANPAGSAGLTPIIIGAKPRCFKPGDFFQRHILARLTWQWLIELWILYIAWHAWYIMIFNIIYIYALSFISPTLTYCISSITNIMCSYTINIFRFLFSIIYIYPSQWSIGGQGWWFTIDRSPSTNPFSLLSQGMTTSPNHKSTTSDKPLQMVSVTISLLRLAHG